MKTVLFLTDCSIESAATLQKWRRRHRPADWPITVVFPTPPTGPITGPLKENRARELFVLWRQLVEEIDPIGLLCISEPGVPEEVVNRWLGTQSYDYLLVENRYCGLMYTVPGKLNQVDSALLISGVMEEKYFQSLPLSSVW